MEYVQHFAAVRSQVVYIILKKLVKHLSPKDQSNRPIMSYKKRDGVKIIENMDNDAIDPEIKRILGKLSLVKS